MLNNNWKKDFNNLRNTILPRTQCVEMKYYGITDPPLGWPELTLRTGYIATLRITSSNVL